MNVLKSQIYCLIKLQPSASALCSSQLPTANLRAVFLSGRAGSAAPQRQAAGNAVYSARRTPG